MESNSTEKRSNYKVPVARKPLRGLQSGRLNQAYSATETSWPSVMLHVVVLAIILSKDD